MKLKKYDIILCKDGKALSSKIVQWFTKRPYHHAQLYLGNYLMVEDMLDGVKVKPINKKLGEFDVFRYRFKITEEQDKLIEEFIQKSINSKYDFLELFMQLFKKKDSRKNGKYICISLIMEAFKYAGLDVGEFGYAFTQVTDNLFFRKIN